MIPVDALKNFLKLESSAGILLVGATVLALVVSNSPLVGWYDQFLNLPVTVAVGELAVDKPLLLWINDGLMAIFFLLIGLEVKREVLQGQLSSRDQLLLPAFGALGGFAVPAAIFLAFTWNDPAARGGWAIPAATDIAFALGVLTLLGSRVPLGLKVFLTSIAIFDDIAAIVVIALFYTEDLSVTSLLIGFAGVLVMIGMNRFRVGTIAPYMLVGAIVWLSVLKSGVHATLAGFIVGLIVPMKSEKHGTEPLYHLEHALHPWVAYLILPLFAFANAGVSLAGVDPEVAFGNVSLGIIAGLFLGKQFGVFFTVAAAIRLGIARMPSGSNWLSLYGVALLTGIGFTMSLFIGTLAYEHGTFDHMIAARVGVLTGSVLSAIVGFIVLRRALDRMAGATAPATAPGGTPL